MTKQSSPKDRNEIASTENRCLEMTMRPQQKASQMRGDTPSAYHLSSPGHCPPKLAPLERLPKRHRVGPSASLDE